LLLLTRLYPHSVRGAERLTVPLDQAEPAFRVGPQLGVLGAQAGEFIGNFQAANVITVCM
jgi:ribosomal protein L11